MKIVKELMKGYYNLVADIRCLRGQGRQSARRFSEAEVDYRAALEFYLPQAQNEAKVYEKEVAAIQNQLGTLLLVCRRLPEAEVALRSALEIRQRLARSEPEIYESEVAITQNNLGLLLCALQRLPEAETAYNTALIIHQRLTQSQPQSRESDVAMIQVNLGALLSSCRRLPEAEVAYAAALKIYLRLALDKPKVYEKNLAATQNNLGALLLDLRRFAEAETAYSAALQIYQRLAQNKPEVYEFSVAMTQNNLGALLRNMRRLPEAEVAYSAALEIYQRLAQNEPEVYEHDVARAQNNLGNLLLDLRRFSEAEVAYRTALEIYQNLAQIVPEIYESDVARTQNNLGALLRNMRRLPEAEVAHRTSLKIRRRLAQTEPEVYESVVATTQNELGNLLGDLQRLPEAEVAYRASLEIYQRLAQSEPEVYEIDVARTQNNLGALLRELRHFSEAEAALLAALEIRQSLAIDEPDVYEIDVAMTQNSLGNLLGDLQRLPEAEVAYRASLEIYQRLAQSEPEVYEIDVAMTQNNLGALLQDFLQRMPEAEAAYRNAQEIYKRYDDPIGKATLLGNLGKLLTNLSTRRAEGIEILQEAMETVEGLRAEVVSIERQQQIVSENFGIYENLLVALMREERYDEALELAEKSRNRTLTDLMVSRDLEPRNAPPALLDEYRETLARARALNDRPTGENGTNGSQGTAPDETPDETRGGLNRIEQTYRRLDELTQNLLEFDPEFLPRASSLSHAEIIELAREARQTLVSFRVTAAGSFVFLVFPDGETDVVSIPDFSADDLLELMFNAPVENKTQSGGGWIADYYNARQDRAATSRWKATLDETLSVLHQRLMAPVMEKLRGFTDLVLVPNRALAILPLHTCWWQGDDGQRRYWLDDFTIRYAPSLTIYRRCREKEIGRQRQTLLGIANPTEDLSFAQWECHEIERIRGDANCLMLWNKQATRGALEGALASQHLLHFSCHGHYDLGAPLNSSISLAGQTELSLADIFQHIQLPHSWLVVLSACETGLSDYRQIADEQFGLSTGFLYAGAPTVYSSLWAVSDGSTALLMILVYQLLQSAPDLDKATLLIRAQRQLRDMTKADALELLKQTTDSPETRALRGQLAMHCPTDRPYQHPVWWAAFQCVGV